jgi:hypothetical protein
MFTLEYKDSQEVGFPPHGSRVSYYSVKELPGLHKSLEPKVNTIKYDWVSSCGEIHEYYDQLTESEYKIGDSRPSKFHSDSDNESHRTVYLTFHLDSRQNYPHGTPTDEFPRIVWEYSHNIRRKVASYMGDDYFPSVDINYLLKTKEIIPLPETVIKTLVNLGSTEESQYYHVTGIFAYRNQLFLVSAAQDSAWTEDAWTKESIAAGKFEDVDVFRWNLLAKVDENQINILLK